MTTTIANQHRSGQFPHDELSCVLAETGYQWSPSQQDTDVWHATAGDYRGYRCELVARLVLGGVEVQGALAAWDTDLSESCQQALARFLVAADAHVSCARFTLQDRSASAVSFAAADRLEIELPDSVFAVVAACRLVWREVRALANDRVAQAYLEAID